MRPGILRRAVTVRRLALAALFALALSFVPVLRLGWTVSPVSAEVSPRFESVGSEVPEVVEPEVPEDEAAEPDEAIVGDRSTAIETDVEPFTTIGVRFTEVPAEPVFARVRDVAGDWGDWRELPVSADEGPDPGSSERRDATAQHGDAVSSEPMWVRDADGFEINAPSAATADAKVVLVREVHRRAVVESTPLAGAYAPPPFGVHSRGEWGARPAASVSLGSTVRLAVVHHSVTSNAYSSADVPGQIRAVQNFHMDGNGWSDIGYNFVVDKFGGIWEGRQGGIAEPVIGAHSAGFNTNSVGVMVLGDYTSATITPAAREAVAQIIGWKLFLHNNDPLGRVDIVSGGSTSIPAGVTVNLPRVVGHRDVGSTACPGSIYQELDWLRVRAQEWTNALRAYSVPFGTLDALTQGAGSVTAQGWAIDPDVAGAARVALSVGGRTEVVDASLYRPDVGAAHPTHGSNHGFSVTVGGLSPGLQTACVTMVNQGYGTGDIGLGCRDVVVADPSGLSPAGAIEPPRGFGGGFWVGGSVRDPDAPFSPLILDVELDGVVVARVPTDPASGGFWAQPMGIIGGRRRVCVVARNIGGGQDVRFACADVGVGATQPIGHWDWVATNAQGQVGLGGWVYDPENLGWAQVVVTIRNRRWVLRADQGRGDLGAVIPAAYGPSHGWSSTLDVGKGIHRVCVDMVDFPAAQLRSLGCRNVVIK
ncbi:MAG TPA: N-acetylmuramoyl-L-alanine amidase [Microthrixaceae bacterium]|nr:N-acetylmuramoyl-L-alanine amidase [Microthrixaceae bacterium]